MSRTIIGWCVQCDGEIEFDFGGLISGPGIPPGALEILEVVEKECDCELSEDELNRARERAGENFIAYMTEPEEW